VILFSVAIFKKKIPYACFGIIKDVVSKLFEYLIYMHDLLHSGFRVLQPPRKVLTTGAKKKFKSKPKITSTSQTPSF